MQTPNHQPVCSPSLVGVLVLFGFITPALVELFRASSTFVRVFVSVLILSPIGFMVGMGFPLGIKAASLVPVAEELNPGISNIYWVTRTQIPGNN